MASFQELIDCGLVQNNPKFDDTLWHRWIKQAFLHVSEEGACFLVPVVGLSDCKNAMNLYENVSVAEHCYLILKVLPRGTIVPVLDMLQLISRESEFPYPSQLVVLVSCYNLSNRSGRRFMKICGFIMIHSFTSRSVKHLVNQSFCQRLVSSRLKSETIRCKMFLLKL
jgi:hypothetical protein